MLILFQASQHIFSVVLDAVENVISVVFDKLLAGDVLIELNVTITDAVDKLIGHLWNLFARTTLETVLHQPFANELF